MSRILTSEGWKPMITEDAEQLDEAKVTAESLEKEIQDATKEARNLKWKLIQAQKKIEELKDQRDRQFGKAFAGVWMRKVGKSIVLTSDKGKAIIFPEATNSYRERKVYWYDVDKKKRGDIVPGMESSRESTQNLAKWLANK